MRALLLLLTLFAWIAIFLAINDMYRIKRYGYIKPQHQSRTKS